MSKPIASKIWRPRSPKGLEPDVGGGPTGAVGVSAGVPDPAGNVVVVVGGAPAVVGWGVVIVGKGCSVAMFAKVGAGAAVVDVVEAGGAVVVVVVVVAAAPKVA